MNPDNQMSGGGSGSLIGSIIVVIILIVGAIYLFSQKASAPLAPEGTTVETPALNPTDNNAAPVAPAPVDEATLDGAATSANTDLTNMEADLKALDKEAGL